MAIAGDARNLFMLVRKGLDVRAIQAHVRKPFRFLLCGDPALVAEMRGLLLFGHDDGVPLDAAACLETVPVDAPLVTNPAEVRAVVFLGRRGDAAAPTSARSPPCARRCLRSPSIADAAPSSPSAAAGRRGVVRVRRSGACSRSVARTLLSASRRMRAAASRSRSAAVFPALRETVAAKLTRDAANNALKVALASAVVDHIPVVGLVLGAFASAGDMVAITGIQVMLMLHIEAAYGRDPDMHRIWQLLPIIGGGFGWRTLARELSGFVPVAGIAIKGAIAYAGTIVVGEGVTFFMEQGRHMTKGQAATLYERTKDDAMRFARDLLRKLRK